MRLSPRRSVVAYEARCVIQSHTEIFDQAHARRTWVLQHPSSSKPKCCAANWRLLAYAFKVWNVWHVVTRSLEQRRLESTAPYGDAIGAEALVRVTANSREEVPRTRRVTA